jgi:hypothetical protein
MKKLLFGLLFCPLFMFGQNVAKVDISNIPYGFNVAVMSGINADSCFSKIVSTIKSHGLFLDKIDKDNGIITTSAKIMQSRNFNTYCLQVYLEKNELQVRLYSIQNLSSAIYLRQIYNSETRVGQRDFRYFAYWVEKIAEISNGKVVYKREYNSGD